MRRTACFGPASPFDFRWLAGAFRANSARKSRSSAVRDHIVAMQELRDRNKRLAVSTLRLAARLPVA